MNIKSILKTDYYGLEDYIDYYFYNMVCLPKDKPVHFYEIDNYHLAIMKDETKRLLVGTKKLRERPWSNFIFYSINRKDFEALFGTNSRRRNISNIDENGNFELEEWDVKPDARNPSALNINRTNNLKIARSLFEDLKKNSPSLFIRAYVYITIIIYDDDDDKISTKNYLTFYFNTSYRFGETNGKTKFISNVTYSYLVEDIDFELEQIENNNRDTIDCVKAFIGDFEFTDQTKYNYDNIVECIENNDKYILVEGAARTGKTIIAMCLLRKYKHAHLLVMNYYFYCSLRDAFETLNQEFPSDRIFHQLFKVKGHYNDQDGMDFSFCIIDECQRLGKKYNLVNRIVSNPNTEHAIFFGDNYQRIRPMTDDGIQYLIDEIVESGESIKQFKFTSSIGVPPEIVRNVKFLLGVPEAPNPYPLGEYKIRAFDTQEDFLNAYQNESLQRKHMTTIQCYSYNFNNFGSFKGNPFINSEYPFFLNSETINNYYFSPFEMISRELDTIYVFIRKDIEPDDISGFVLTQLYVLFTRGTISLNVYFECPETREIFKERLRKINEYSVSNNNNIESSIVDGYFYIREDLIEQFYSLYNIDSPQEKIKNRHITRLVHFTEESNLPNILKNGLLPRSVLVKNNNHFDFNDNARIDGHPDSICLSVENPNCYLLESFKKKYPNKKYKLITINPSILYTAFVKNEDKIKLVDRLYCNYNAAAKLTSKSDDDLDIMYNETVQTYHYIFCR